MNVPFGADAGERVRYPRSYLAIWPLVAAILAGHRDFATTRRYVHPQAHPRSAQWGDKNGHRSETAAGNEKASTAVIQKSWKRYLVGAGGFQTPGPSVPTKLAPP